MNAPALRHDQAGHLGAVRGAVPATTRAARGPLLAVWAEPGLQQDSLLTRLIEHYTDRGDLVLADSEDLALILGLRRRLLAHNAQTDYSTVKRLPRQELARLALITLAPSSKASLEGDISRLAPGSFIALLPTSDSTNLGRLVQSAEKAGLRYWQHIVAFDPASPDSSKGRSRRDIVVLRSEQADIHAPLAAVAA